MIHGLSVDSGNPGTPLLERDNNRFTAYSISADGRFVAVKRLPSQADTAGSDEQADYLALIDLAENREIEIPMVGIGNWGIAASPDGSAVVDVQTHPDIVLGEPRVFYQGNFVNVGGRSYDISPDGKRALIIKGPADAAHSIRIITNWLHEVERIVSASESP